MLMSSDYVLTGIFFFEKDVSLVSCSFYVYGCVTQHVTVSE